MYKQTNRICSMSVRKSIVGRFDGVYSTESCRDSYGSSWEIFRRKFKNVFGGLVTNIRANTQGAAPESIQRPLTCKATIRDFTVNKSTTAPPEDPPQESNWFTGFRVRPMRLLTVSPSSTGNQRLECRPKSQIPLEKTMSGTYQEGLREAGLGLQRQYCGRIYCFKQLALQYMTAPSERSSVTI
jgi:hypothetical protein